MSKNLYANYRRAPKRLSRSDLISTSLQRGEKGFHTQEYKTISMVIIYLANPRGRLPHRAGLFKCLWPAGLPLFDIIDKLPNRKPKRQIEVLAEIKAQPSPHCGFISTHNIEKRCLVR